MSEATEQNATTDPAGQKERVVMRPGNGWKHLAGAVYERHDGLRVHLYGICKLSNGEFVHNEQALLQRLTRINGGNTKRGAMAWANTLEARAA